MSIKRRTVYFDNTDGIARFWDWAKVSTSLGTMVEPFLPNDRYTTSPAIEFDATDEIVRIDEIRSKPIDVHITVLSGGGAAIHGGEQMPRDGR